MYLEIRILVLSIVQRPSFVFNENEIIGWPLFITFRKAKSHYEIKKKCLFCKIQIGIAANTLSRFSVYFLELQGSLKNSTQ